MRTRIRFDKLDTSKPIKKNGHVDDDNWALTFVGPGKVFQQVIWDNVKGNRNLVSFFVEVEFKPLFISGTDAQRGKLYAAIFPAFYQFYRDNGYRGMLDEEIQAELFLHPSVGFYELRKNILTGNVEKHVKRLSKASKQEITDLIEGLLQLASEMDIHIPDVKSKRLVRK